MLVNRSPEKRSRIRSPLPREFGNGSTGSTPITSVYTTPTGSLDSDGSTCLPDLWKSTCGVTRAVNETRHPRLVDLLSSGSFGCEVGVWSRLSPDDSSLERKCDPWNSVPQASHQACEPCQAHGTCHAQRAQDAQVDTWKPQDIQGPGGSTQPKTTWFWLRVGIPHAFGSDFSLIGTTGLTGATTALKPPVALHVILRGV